MSSKRKRENMGTKSTKLVDISRESLVVFTILTRTCLLKKFWRTIRNIFTHPKNMKRPVSFKFEDGTYLTGFATEDFIKKHLEVKFKS